MSQPQSEAVSRRYLAVEAAGLRLALPAPTISAVHQTLDITPVVGTEEWFLGLAVVQGRLLPVSDLGLWCGLRRTAGACLQLATHLVHAGLQVDKVLAIVEQLPATSSEDTVAESGNAATVRQRSRSLARLEELDLVGHESVSHGERRFRCLNVEALVGSPQFLDIGTRQ